MGLRRNVDMIKRRKWSIVVCGIVVGSVVGGLSAFRTPTYTAGARVRPQPDAAAGQLDSPANSRAAITSAAPVTGLMDATTSAAVAKHVAAHLPGVAGSVSVHQVGTTGLVEFTATNANRERAARIANAFARAAIDDRRLAVVASLRQAADGLGPQLAKLQARMTDLDAQVQAKTASPAASAQLDAAATQYQTLQSRQQELRGDIDVRRGGAVLVAPATSATTRSNSHPIRDGLLGGVLGLLLGLVIAATRESLDERVRSTEEIERATGLPILAELPRDQRSEQQPTRVSVSASPKSALSEAIRTLRAGIELRDIEHHPTSLLITSAASGEGKSLVSANLAAAYALAGYRTVLLDGDLRTPRLSSVFGTYPEPLVASGEAVNGLSSLLRALQAADTDRSTLQQAALLRTPIENLLVLPAGPEPANPAELLDSAAMADLLADLAVIADVVIIDAPPLLPVSDAVGLARHADAVVLVAVIGESDGRALRRIRQMLAAHPRVLGVVVNKVAASASYASYAPRRRGTPTPHPSTRHSLRVVRPIEVPSPPTGFPDANGDLWIDLSDEPDPYDRVVASGELQLNSWGR